MIEIGIVCLIVVVGRIVFRLVDGNSSLPPKLKRPYYGDRRP
jgi:hypothetical protein